MITNYFRFIRRSRAFWKIVTALCCLLLGSLWGLIWGVSSVPFRDLHLLQSLALLALTTLVGAYWGSLVWLAGLFVVWTAKNCAAIMGGKQRRLAHTYIKMEYHQ